jgi:YYY domain-containing protein
MLIVIVWWLWMQVIGLAALPMAHRFFRRLPDRGYAFARPLGLLLTSYVLWLGASLGLLRNSIGGAVFSILIVAVVSIIIYRRGRARGDPGILDWLRAGASASARTHSGALRLIVAVELVFAGALALWALLRAYSPELTTAGGEKFMEIMYLNSIGRSEYFPPQDAWLSGYAISYYYFGYVMIAMLTRLSGFAAHMTFNVGLALLFALTCTGAFGLVYNLVQGAKRQDGLETGNDEEDIRPRSTSPIAWGLLGAVLVAVLGNLEGFLEVLYSLRLLPRAFWQWLDIKELNEAFDMTVAPSLMPSRSGWWWWRASRVIHELDPQGNSMGIQPIDEFPGFSFLLGDMHPHVLALPFVLLALALALNALLKGAEGAQAPEGSGGWLEPAKRLSLLVPLCLGALAFLNTWDFPIYWLVFVAAYGLGQWGHPGRNLRSILRDMVVTGGLVAGLGFLFYLPFYIGFQSQAGGLLPSIYVGTRFRQYFVMFGPFLVAITGLLTVLTLQWKGERKRLLRSWIAWTAAFILLPLGFMVLIILMLLAVPQGRELLEGIRRIPAVYEVVGDEPWLPLVGHLLVVKLRTWVMPLVVAGMAALGTVLLLHASSRDAEEGEEEKGENPLSGSSIRFVLLCAVVGLLLTLSVEFFYLIDNFRVRMNTIFKFYFQAWNLMSVASAFAVYWLSRTRAVARRRDQSPGAPAGRWRATGATVFLLAFWLLFAMGMVYPVLGNISRAGGFGHEPNLDGMAYLGNSHPDDYAAITWLRENVEGAPVLLEAPGTGGSSYVYEGRVSALTGLPTLLGWAGHEGQWRGSYDIQHAREPDIETIYNTLDPQAASTLMEAYDITYVYVGPLERNKYDPRALRKFEQFMDVVYQQDGVTIYQRRR